MPNRRDYKEVCAPTNQQQCHSSRNRTPFLVLSMDLDSKDCPWVLLILPECVNITGVVTWSSLRTDCLYTAHLPRVHGKQVPVA